MSVKFPLTMTVILAATFYATHRGWEGMMVLGLLRRHSYGGIATRRSRRSAATPPWPSGERGC